MKCEVYNRKRGLHKNPTTWYYYYQVTLKSIISTRVLAIFAGKGIRKYNTFHLYAVRTPCVVCYTFQYKIFDLKEVQLKSIIIGYTSCSTSFL